jgi:hypothetical protein
MTKFPNMVANNSNQSSLEFKHGTQTTRFGYAIMSGFLSILYILVCMHERDIYIGED